VLALVSNNDSTEAMQRNHSSFNVLSFSVPVDRSATPSQVPFATMSVMANQSNTTSGGAALHRITVGRFVVRESFDFPIRSSGFAQLLDQANIVATDANSWLTMKNTRANLAIAKRPLIKSGNGCVGWVCCLMTSDCNCSTDLSSAVMESLRPGE
jgi:hypothetical protein